MESYHIRTADIDDLDEIAAIEAECFPKEEAATKEQLRERIQSFGNHFYVVEYGDQLIGFINGMVTNQRTISDDLYEDATLHTEDGKWQSVFGLDVISSFRRQGVASQLLKKVIQTAEEEKRQGVILTCKEGLIPFYEAFGFKNLGVSESVHGGVIWYDMILSFEDSQDERPFM